MDDYSEGNNRFESKMKEVICGLDVGSWSFKVCAYDWKAFEVLTNEANFRETPSLVSFTHSHRLIGEEANNKLKSNYQNTVRAPLRLIGLSNDYQIIDEQLRDCTAKYYVDDYLTFTLGQKKTHVQPEELLIAVMGNARKILEGHSMTADLCYITVPSYLSQQERRIIKRCAQISGTGREARIVDDWVCICSEYSCSRVKELTGSMSNRTVLFVDVGYAKTSLFVVEFGPTQCKLMDCQHLRFVGARNMDRALTEFYDKQFKSLYCTEESLFSMPKALVKLGEHIEKQRKVLSANSQHQLHAESLVQDTDLTYNLTRVEFESVIGPVLNQIATALKTLKARMPEKLRLHSIQLLGGASRIPALRRLVQDIFIIEPSKTLNQSQAMVHGATIFGAKDAGLFFYDYSVININLLDINACWHYSGNSNFLGEVQSEYKYKQILFGCNSKLPGENVLSFGNEGPVEMYVYYEQNISRKSIAYVRFNTPNRVRFTLDSSKIVSAKLEAGAFTVCKFYERKEERWGELARREKELVQHEERLRHIYELKNEYQAKIYAFKNKIEDYRQVMNEPEMQFLDAELSRIEDWIEKEHTRPLGSEEDIKTYKLKIEQIDSSPIFDNLQVRKRNIAILIKKYSYAKELTDFALSRVMSESKARKMHFLKQWLVESLERMKETCWEGYYLNEASLDFAAAQVHRIQALLD